MTDVDVIIVNWNTKEHLAQCIESFTQEGVCLQQIVVVDQGSTDGSKELVQSNYADVQLVVNTETDGYSFAVNKGFKKTTTPFVVVSNADVVVHSGALNTMKEVMKAEPLIGLEGCRMCDGMGRHVTRFSRTSITRGLMLEVTPRSFKGKWRNFEHRFHKNTSPFDVTYVEGAFFMVRRSAFESVGCLDEGFSFFFEDADLPLRILKTGFRVIHVPSASVTHVGGSSFSKAPLRHAEEFYKNMILLYQKHAPRRAVWFKRLLILILSMKRLCLTCALFFFPVGSRRKATEERLLLAETKYRSVISINGSPTALSVGGEVKKDWNPLVSVIIPTYNREGSLVTLLERLKDQTYNKFEIIVVDQSEEISRAKRNAYATWEDKLRLFTPMRPNRSLAKNVGISHALGDLFLFCDDDIVPPQDFVETHVEMHRDTTIGGVSCRHTEPGLEYIRSEEICRVTYYGRLLDGYQSDVTCFVGTLAGPNMSVKKETQRQVGYFETLLKGTSIFEEQDFSARLLNLNKKILFTNRITFPHEPQSDGNKALRQKNPSQYYHDFHHNELVYFLKNRNHFCLFLVIPFCFLRSVKQSIRYKLSIREGIHIFLGVFEGIRTYYRSLR